MFQRFKSSVKDASLQRKLIGAFVILISFVGVTLVCSSLISMSDIIRQKNNTYAQEIVLQTTNNLEYYLRDVDEMTTNLLVNTAMQEVLLQANRKIPDFGEKASQDSVMESILYQYALMNDDILALSVFSDTGVEYCAKQNMLDETRMVFSKEKVYEANGTLLWAVADDSERNICAARAVFDLLTMKPLGYVSVLYKESYFGDILEDISPKYSTAAYVIDGNGYVLSSNNKKNLGELFRNYNPEQNAPLSSYETQRGGTRYYSYVGNRMDNGWTLVMMIPKNEFAHEINRYMLISLLVALAVIFAAVRMILYAVKLVVSPIKELCRNMEIVGRGNFKVRSYIHSKDEIGMLGRSYNAMVDNIETLIEKNYLLEISRRQAELEFLKMQINPHFLYNTLETINWMARINHMDDIGDVTTALGELLRAMVKQENLIPIRQEVKNISNYTLIQKYRFGDKISFQFDVDDRVNDIQIPNFLLQPLIENAIIHGLEPKMTAGRVYVHIQKREEYIFFSVSDNGVGIGEEVLKRMSLDLSNLDDKSFIGLRNVNKRLQLYFGEACQLHLESEINTGTKASFRIPLESL